LSQPYKICPICHTPAHRNAAVCSTCGATLHDVEVVGERPVENRPQPAYDYQYGETDLDEAQLSRRTDVFFLGGLVTIALLACVAVTLFLGPRLFSAIMPGSAVQQPTMTPVPTRAGAGAGNVPVATNTPRPTLQFATVTPAPPTPTITPTPGPCMRTVQPNDTLLSLAYSCGHTSLDIIPVIVELNDLSAPEAIQIGQEIEIPWPTPTQDPNSLPTETPADSEASIDPDRTLAPAEQALAVSNRIATATLQPGVQWHTVQPNENIISIAYRYGANIEILSQLNPEVTFSQCDFGSPTGGPNCIVNIYVGQRLRVPAPTPTPTIPPTPSGSETPTLTPSPTINAPSLTDPGDLSVFRRNDLITLRWVATGALVGDQVYRVEVHDLTADATYTADTQDLFLIVPEAWQGQDGQRHDYTWRVSVISRSAPDNPIYVTDPRRFSWEARGAVN